MTDVPPPLRSVAPPPLASAPRPTGSWRSRNYLWVIVPLAILAGIIAMAGFVAGIIAFVFGLMRSSDAYQQGLARAQKSPAAIDALGTPVTPGWFVSGNIEFKDDSGTADIDFPVSGPRGAGDVHVVGTKAAGVWTYSKMDLTLQPSHRVIDLAKPAP